MSAPIVKNFINGNFVDPSSDATEHVNIVSPSTGETLARVPLCKKTDVDLAVEAGNAAFPYWSGLTIKQRGAIMFKFHSLVNKNIQELAEIIVKENGKNITEALADVAKGNETVEWACALPELAPGRKLMVSGGINCEELRVPLGVVAAIVPFNFPAMVPMWTVPISLCVGNCVILKPSEKVPLTMMRMIDFMIEAGVPPGVFQVVQGGADVVTSMCDHPDIAAVTFVGSSKVAEIVSKRCHAVNKRVLALGGAKNHLIALPDCDTTMAARDIVASFAGCAGQRCMAASALLVVDNSDDDINNNELIANVVANTAKLVAGTGPGQVGPVIDNFSKERIVGYINEAEANGAKILLDGRSWASKSTGSWVGPTIIYHHNKSDRAMHEEIFGPVLSIHRVKTWNEAIEIENGNPYGNAACIYTEKGGNAQWFLKRFRASMLGVNIGIPVPREPFSFGGLYGTRSKFGDCDITGDGAMEFFTNRIKITSKWSTNYGKEIGSEPESKRAKNSSQPAIVDKANFDGKM
jgi:methylmalonic acid semialdehyde dehydrogenase